MNPACDGMKYTEETGDIDVGSGTPVDFYHVEEVVPRNFGECTTNILGSSVMFTCNATTGCVDEHVYIDAAAGEVLPATPDCTGDVKYVMPICNGCNDYDWGSMSAVWDAAECGATATEETTTEEPATTEEPQSTLTEREVLYTN